MILNIGPTYSSTPPGPPVAGRALDPHTHCVQFYEEDTYLLDELSRFIGAALGAGDVALVIATPAHRSGLEQRLQARGLDLPRALAQGRYVALDAAATLARFMGDELPDAARFREHIGGIFARAAAAGQAGQARVTAFGEMVAMLWAAGQVQAALHLERLWNDLAQTYAFDLLCAYSMTLFPQAGDDGLLGQICAAHSHVIPAESYTLLVDDAARGHAITLWQQKAQALATEIEERKKVEQALRERNEELRAAVAARDEFMSIAAHELKTPITSLRGFAQLLLRDTQRRQATTPERLAVALRAIEAQSAKLSQLVARLLDATQIEAGKLRIEPVPVDLVALVQATLAQHQGAGTHTLVLEGPPQLEVVVDPVRFEQVITNLLNNAVKFSPPGSRVTVELGHDAAGGIRLAVTDQGIGVPPDQWTAIFERFQQASGLHHLSGLGLGLYITREIVELHGGRIWIEAPAQRGSRFVVALPPATN